MPTRKCSKLIATFLILSGVTISYAQVADSTISGQVFDPSGRVLPGAQVTAEDSQRGTVRTTLSDAAGAFSLIGLEPAVYILTASSEGFSNSRREGIRLGVDSALVVDFHLAVGGPNTEIEVNEPYSYLQTQNADLGTVIDQRMIDQLPLNTRDFLQLALLAPGTFPPVEGSQLSANGSTSMEVNGGREEYNNFLLDGVDNNDPYVNGYVVEPPVDSVQEFKLATSSYAAEYGRSAAGQVNVITRRGSNDLNFTAYEYFRNKALDARNYFDTREFVKPPYLRNQFGLAVGGPVRKDATFFFANTDFFRERLSISQQGLVPTDRQRAGNVGVPVTDPVSGLTFSDGVIPDPYISPIAKEILKMYPEPNLSGSVNNYLGQPSQPQNRNEDTFRGDHVLSPRDDLTLRYAMGTLDLQQPYQVGLVGAVPGFGVDINDFTQNALVREQHSFGAQALNTMSLGFNRFSRAFYPQNHNINVGSLWGVDWLNLPSRDNGYPDISVSGFSPVGDDPTYPNLRHTNTYQITDALTYNRGRHIFTMGADIRSLQLNGNLDLYVRGSLSFYGGITGSPLGDLLLGYPSFGIQSQANNPIHLRTQSYDGYFQDNFKLTRDVVMNLGLRYDFNTPPTDPKNAMYTFDTLAGKIVRVGTNGVTDSGIRPDYKNVAPRLGVSWNPAKDLIVRAGYGMFYDSGMFIIGSAAYFNPPQFVMNVFFPSDAGLLTLRDPLPSSSAYAPPASLSVLDPGIATSSLQQWNLAGEHSFGTHGVVTLSYVGSAGSHLLRERDMNQAPLSSAGSQDNLQSRRPYPDYGSIFYVQSQGSSNYNAFQARFTGHPVSSLQLMGSYTYSHSIDSASAFLGNAADPNFPQDSYDVPAERAPSSFDMRHRLSVAFAYSLPHGNRWTRNSELQGIVAVQSGQPFTPLVSFDNSNTGNTGQQSGSDRPNRIGNPHLAHPNAVEWFNTAMLPVASANNFGNAGRNSLLGPGYSAFDLSLLRRFSFHERATLTLQAQSFNLFNHPNLQLPAAFADQPNFGTISSANSPRELQIAARISF